MTLRPPASLPARWSLLDFSLHTFLAVNPLVLGLWAFSLAPVIGGNVLVAAVVVGAIMTLGAVVYGVLAGTWPWTGGDYAWQTRFLEPRVGGILALSSWWLVVATLAPIYGNAFRVEVVDPILAQGGWDGLAGWFGGREGIFAASLVPIALGAGFVGCGMRRAAIVQRTLVVIGSVGFLGVLGLLITTDTAQFQRSFDREAADVYGAGPLAYDEVLRVGSVDSRVTDIEALDTLRLIPLLLLFSLWIGWASPLAGEIRGLRPRSALTALISVAVISTTVSVGLLVAIGRSMGWQFWNETNNLYWGTLFGTTATTPLGAWPHPVVLTGWLLDGSALRMVLLGAMAAWIVGLSVTLFLPATRVLVATASDRVLPASLGRVSGDSVPIPALALLVVPACGFAALDAYWDDYASWTVAGVIALAVTTGASAVTAVRVFWRRDRRMALVAAVFATIVAVAIVAWVVDPVFRIRALGPLLFLAVVYAVAVGALGAGRRYRTSQTVPGGTSEKRAAP